ncbi:type I polyketide synthase [Desulfonema ishimotonii]|uniref:Phenolphthiocerol/phthiocerol polyketide synthase subunit E n=1 Tax=Desulfonema ishimotonii TaxID=45657 RepID=A0A401FXU2_9BACT|nr:type I polyketide synthase [Desulfonema ishimotonii]GBC61780.1 type I polyketide synthase [Desulfonema ishimotonii]
MEYSETYESLESVAVIGMSGRFPGASTIDKFWENLKQGVPSVTFFSDEDLKASGVDPELLKNPAYVRARGVLDDIGGFDALFFGISPGEARIMDVQHRIFLECAWEALENAGYAPGEIGVPVGLFAGSGMNTYFLNNLWPARGRLGSAGDYQLMIGNDKDALATMTAYKLNLKGPCVSVQTACSSSLVAVHLACQSLLNGESDMALAGGVSVDVPHRVGYLYEEGMILSPDGYCRAFDADAGGTVPGSGAGIVVLKRLEDAVADRDTVYAVIRGSAINNDGSLKVGYTAPSVEGQRDLIIGAQAIADVEPDTITCIEAHGTGTTLGDPIEISALTQAFRAGTPKKQFCAIGSVKTNIGHLDTASGVTGLIKTVLALRHKMIPPSLNFEKPNPEADFENSPFYVNTRLAEWHPPGNLPRRAGVSSFGIGGTNAHVILEEAPAGEDIPESRPVAPCHLLVLSAKTPAALDRATENLAACFEARPDTNLADAAHTLQAGRRAFHHRRIAVCRDTADAAALLRAPDAGRVFTGSPGAGDRSVVFMFSGQGAQYADMGRELYRTEPVFREAVDQCAEILKPLMNTDLRTLLYPMEGEAAGAADRLRQTGVAQPALFVIEYALATLWMAWGIHPRAMIGHSIGEYVAACLAGVFSLEDGLALVAARGRMMGSLPAGAMIAVPLPETGVRDFLSPDLSIAAVNAPGLCVVSGPTGAVDALEDRLRPESVACRRLHTSHAFHSEMMDPILEPFARQVRAVELKPPRIPYISNVTGTWITASEATDPDYWAGHLRQTVYFEKGMGTLMEGGGQIFLEIGPGRTLSTFAGLHPARSPEHMVLNSLRHPGETGSDTAFLLTTLGRLWLAGVGADLSGGRSPGRRIALPTYPFDRKRCWTDPPPLAGLSPDGGKAGRLPDIADWFYIPSWKRTPVPPAAGDADSGHWLLFADDGGLGEGLTRSLEAEGRDVVMVKAGAGFMRLSDHRYIISPRRHNDYNTLMNELSRLNRMPKTIVHLWNVTPPSPEDLSEERCAAAQYKGFYSLIFLAQALGNQNIPHPVRMSVITAGVGEVTGQEVLAPERATVLGPVKIIPQEYPGIRCCGIDIEQTDPGTGAGERLIARLLAELKTDLPDPVVALRGAHRWIQTFEPVRLAHPAGNEQSRLREKGVYLITGGLGGMGLALAEYLAQAVKARLILTGRSAFPEPTEWESWLSAHGPEEDTSRKILKLRELEALGAEVMAVCADVADPERMKAVIGQAEKRFGPVNGVVHTAGLADYAGVIRRRSREETEPILAPKVRGTLVLDHVLKDARPDFFVLCSSLGNLLYREKFGQVAYNAANEFLDAFAAYRTLRDGTFTLSVNWDDWREVGMSVVAVRQWAEKTKASAPGGKSAPADLLKDGLLPAEGAEVFARMLAADHSRVAVSTQDLNFLMARELSAANPFGESPDEDDVDGMACDRPELDTAYVAPETETEKALARIWKKLLGIGRIGVHDNFFDLGGHSLNAVQMITLISEQMGVEMAVGEIYSHPGIGDLAEQIDAKMAPRSEDARQYTPLVPIQPEGDRPPLFFIHPADGNVSCYAELARHLGPDQPLYGLQAFGLDPATAPLNRIGDMVREYLAAIRTVRPRGPFLLGGYCQGGTIAYEMARTLEGQGETVPVLFIVDTLAPPLFSKVLENPVQDFMSFAQNLGGPFNVDLLPAYCQIREVDPGLGIEGVYHDVLTLDDNERLQVLSECVRSAGLEIPGMSTGQLNRLFQVFTGLCSAVRTYTIAPCESPVVVFRAADEPDQPDDPTMGWRGFAPDLTAYDIPGDHFTMLTPPHVRLLAGKITAHLERAGEDV